MSCSLQISLWIAECVYKEREIVDVVDKAVNFNQNFKEIERLPCAAKQRLLTNHSRYKSIQFEKKICNQSKALRPHNCCEASHFSIDESIRQSFGENLLAF